MYSLPLRARAAAPLSAACLLIIVLILSNTAAAEAPPTVLSSSIRMILESATHAYAVTARGDLWNEAARVYERSLFSPLWIGKNGPTDQASAVVGQLVAARAEGLDPADYGAERLADELARYRDGQQSEADLAQFDTALTLAALGYVLDAYRGRIDPRPAGFESLEEPPPFDPAEFVETLARADDPAEKLAALHPQLPVFSRLRAALARQRELTNGNKVPRLGEMATLRPGESHAQVPILRGLLRALGDLNSENGPPAAKNLYSSEIVAAVKRFQQRHGLNPDGVLGPATLRQMQVPPQERAVQIELAMERLRWLPRRLAARFVLVNIPAFQLTAFEGDDPQLVIKAVVGKAARRTQTPLVHGDMTHIVFRPYWNVPPGIAREEILPKAERDPNYLTRHRMVVAGKRIRQLPGPDNALGLIKFIFPNPHHVYLHDTPQRALFHHARRDFSHGCVRVADAVALAQWILRDQQGWDRTRIEHAMRDGADNRWLALEQPIPVYLFYSTAVVDRENRTYFYEDIYGHDARLRQLLASRRASP